jgi:N-sulfoglucosamine sulfohydrolase
MKAFRAALVLGSLFLVAAFGASADAQEQLRPNILWISVEDISADLGCYGSEYSVSPSIDRLAAEGVRYTRAFSVAGVCAPSRSSIITGMYPSTIGTQYMRCKGVPPAYVKCFTEYLRAAGYYCTNDSKTDYNFDSPVTAWDDSRPGAHWRNRPRKDQPFFAVINLTTTHESQIRQPEEKYQKLRAMLSPEQIHDPKQAELPPYYPDTPLTRQDWARYHDCIAVMDRQVGKILKDLEDDGLADDTAVFFWSDHGRGLPRAKRWLYDSGTNVPLIVRWPGRLNRNGVSDDLVSLMDLGPTVLRIAGLDVPKHMQGKAFLGDAGRYAPRKYVYGIRDRMDETTDMMRSVRDARFKYIRNYMPQLPYAQRIAYMDEMPTMQEWRRLAAEGKLAGPQKHFFAETKPVEELYDLVRDPHEIQNLAGDPEFAEELARLRAAHKKWVEETNDIGPIPEAEHWERVRPGGTWSTAEKPVIKVVEGTAIISCETEGASIAYSLGDKDHAGRERWLLYHEPFAVDSGSAIRAVACRLGYRDSEQVELKAP